MFEKGVFGFGENNNMWYHILNINTFYFSKVKISPAESYFDIL